MIMDKCPKCGTYRVEYDTTSKSKKCYKSGCNYEEKYPYEQWLREHDLLPKLAESLRLRRI